MRSVTAGIIFASLLAGSVAGPAAAANPIVSLSVVVSDTTATATIEVNRGPAQIDSCRYVLDSASPTECGQPESHRKKSTTYAIRLTGLADGQHTITASITLTDLATVGRSETFNVQATYPPVAVDDANSITEKAIPNSVSGNVLANDTDVNGDTLAVPAPGTGVFDLEFGSLELHADGSYVYTLDNSNPMVQALDDGQQLQDTMTYVASDGTFNAIGAIAITIHGVGNNTEWPVANVDPNDQISEDDTSPRTGNVLDNDFDADGDTLVVTNPGEYVLDYGTLVLHGDGSYAYSVNNVAVQWLHFPQTVEDVFEYRITDQQGGFGSMDLTFHVFGLDDAPIAVDDVNSISEDAVPNTVSGNVLANDTDVEGDLLSTLDDPRITSYGTLVMNSDGSYLFTLDNSNPEVDGLNDGETLTATIQHYIVMDHFVIDGIAHGQVSESATLTITIHGVTDDPAS